MVVKKLSDFDKISVRILASADGIVERSAQVGRNAAIKKVRVDTGRLKGSITVSRVGFMWFKLHSNVEYAIYQDQGTAFMSGSFFMLAGYNAFVNDFHTRMKKRIGKILTSSI